MKEIQLKKTWDQEMIEFQEIRNTEMVQQWLNGGVADYLVLGDLLI